MEVPYFAPDLATQQAISARHGLNGDWELLGPRGQVHSVFRVCDAVVRIPRNDPEWINDTLTEVVALRALATSSIRTPRLLGFDDQCDLVPVPYCVVEHFDGLPVIDVMGVSVNHLVELGAMLARLHVETTEVHDPENWLDQVDFEEADLNFDQAATAGSISREEQIWASTLLDQVRGSLESDCERVFVHNDVHEHNTLIGPPGVALIDWGDAGWGDPCFDFSTMPASWLVPVLAEYERHRPLHPSVRERLVWNQLGKALRRLGGPVERRSYGRLRMDGLRTNIDHILPLVQSQ